MEYTELITTLMAAVIPFITSKWLWPLATKLSGKLDGLGNGWKMAAITVGNGLLAALATALSANVAALEQFGMSDLQGILTVVVGFLTTLIFKAGKESTLPPTA